ncbi:hypothetical protein D9M70_593510 [compost metagenome]
MGSIFEAGRQHDGPQAVIEPAADPRQRGAPHDIQNRADQHRCRDDERQHEQRVGAAARQDAIVNLQQVNGGSQQEQVIGAAIEKDQQEGSRAGLES